MTVTDTRITRYEDGEFYVDIVESRTDFEAWLCRKDYGVAEMLVACPKEQPTGMDVNYYSFLSMVENTLDLDEHDYDEKYGEPDECDYEDDDFTSVTCGDYSPSSPWNAPGMRISDFI